MKKRAFAIALTLLMTVSLLSSCGQGGSAGSSSPANNAGGSSTSSAGGGGVTNSGDGIGWPNGSITLMVGYSAGGSTDIGARYLATALEKELGVSVIVENKPGSGSWLCWNELLYNAAKDGNTFALVNPSILYGPYDETNPREETLDDFCLLANHVVDYSTIAIRDSETRFTDMESLIEYGKEHTLLIAASSTTINSADVTVTKMLEKEYGMGFTVIPVDGSNDSLTMFKAGEVDILITKIGDMAGCYENGYHPVVLFAPERSDLHPDCPTGKELGIDYVSFSARGYAYPQGVDQAIVDKMIAAMKNCFEDPEYAANMESAGLNLEYYEGEEYKNLLQKQLDQALYYWGYETK